MLTTSLSTPAACCQAVVAEVQKHLVSQSGRLPVGGVRPPSAVPDPAADLLLSWIDNRDNMNTAINPASKNWLFPGRRAGQPIHPGVLTGMVNELGIPATAGRGASIRQHVREMPAPVVADELGYHPVTTAGLAAPAGNTWSRYAPGDHSPLHRPHNPSRPTERC